MIFLKCSYNLETEMIDFYLLEKDDEGNIISRADNHCVKFGKMGDESYFWNGNPTFKLFPEAARSLLCTLTMTGVGAVDSPRLEAEEEPVNKIKRINKLEKVVITLRMFISWFFGMKDKKA